MVLEHAKVDRQTFERNFADLQECFVDVLAELSEQFLRAVAEACASESRWRLQIRAVAYAMLEFLVEDADRARFLFVESPFGGDRAQLIRDQGLEAMYDLIDRGRYELPDPDRVSRATAEAIAGTIFNRIHTAIEQGALEVGTAMVPELMYTVVLPYLGAEAAMEELSIPPPRARPGLSDRYLPPVREEEREPPSGGPDDELGPLPAGRHGYSSEQVAHNQRERLIAALVQVVDEHGYNDITTTASVSRRVFYENFEGKEACFLAAFEIVVSQLREVMTTAAAAEPDWPHAVIAALDALLGFLAAEPELARLSLIASLAAGPTVAEHFREAILSFVPYLRLGRAERQSPRELPASTEDSLLGALASLLGRSVGADETADLQKLLPDLAEFLLTPYLGPEEAERLARPAA